MKLGEILIFESGLPGSGEESLYRHTREHCLGVFFP
jgi:hypothetical protein